MGERGSGVGEWVCVWEDEGLSVGIVDVGKMGKCVGVGGMVME